MPDAKVLGQLLLMQDILINLPNENSIFSFVCKGILDIPGVRSAKYFKNSNEFQNKSAHTFYFGNKETKFGAIQIKVDDHKLFSQYEQYLRNFFFMVEVILEDRYNKHLIDIQNTELEKKVTERTRQLKKEIEDREKAEKLVKQSEQKYRSLFENMTTGFALHEMIFDKNGNSYDYRYLEVNPAFEKLTGLLSNNIIGKTIKEVMPNIENYWIETFGKVIKTGNPISYHNYSEDIGRYFDTWTFKTGKNKFATIFTDATERVKTEQELKKNEKKLKEQNEEYETLNEELNERNAELHLAKEMAEESNRLKTAFLQNMSHEIRTPMNAIYGFSGMLEKQNLSAEKRKSFISIIQNSAKQLLSIINDILAISSLETKQEKLNLEAVCINDILVELLSIYKTQASNLNLSLFTKQPLTDQDSTIVTDKTKITQILTNLLSNALKYTHEGSIEFGYEHKDDVLEFYVKDTGKGIKSENHKKIFDRFQRVETNQDRYISGTGLGLSISKGFVELLGGEIWLESELDIGSTFYFTIPYDPVKEKKIVNSKSFQNRKKPNTILVAEDEEYNYLFIEEVLSNSGFDLIHAKNGEESIDHCKTNQNIRLVLMDIKMPKIDGHTAAKEIKKLRPELIIIAQSAYAQENEIERFKDIFDDYLTKPIEENVLLQKVEKYLQSK